MNIGLVYPQTEYGNDPSAIREFAQTAEGLGFSHILVYDHVLGANPQTHVDLDGPYTYQHAFQSPLLLFSFMASVTTKIEFVTGIIILPQRQTALFAKQSATLDILSGGRAYLGIGAAWYEDEAIGYGIPYPSTSERFEKLEDNLQLAKALWEGAETSFEGQHFSAPAITNNPPPLSKPHPRILIGGMGPKKTLRMVAQYADACNFFEGAGLDKMQESLDTLKSHCDALGRDYNTIEKTSLGTIDLSGDDSINGVIKRIKELSSMGFTHTIFNMPDVHKITPLESFANEIIPAVKEF